jgi:hypothetical protein
VLAGKLTGVTFIIVGALAHGCAYLNERYGDLLSSSKRGQLTEAERGWLERSDKERRTLLLVVVGALLVIGGIISLFV